MESKTTTISFSDMGTVSRAFWQQKITDDQLFSGRYPKKQWLVLTQQPHKGRKRTVLMECKFFSHREQSYPLIVNVNS